jgi:hypothetical protein
MRGPSFFKMTNIIVLEWQYKVENLSADLRFIVVTNNLADPTNWVPTKNITATSALVKIVNFTNTYQTTVTSTPQYNFFSFRASNSFGLSDLATK